MVTINTLSNVTEDKAMFEFYRLSSDTKPTNRYNGLNISNGSSFFEIDTQSISFYNEAANVWV